MAAPALVLLADGSTEDRAAQVVMALRKRMQELRPGLSIHLAFLDHCPPTGPQVVATLASRGVREIVFVPLDLTRATDPSEAAQVMLSRVKEHYSDIHFALSQPIGPAVELLSSLDTRLRQALKASHAVELDGLILSVPGSGDTRGNALIARRARQWHAHHKLPVQIAYADQSGTTVRDAMAALRTQGRRAVAVGSMFLAPDDSFVRVTEQAIRIGAIAVSAPIGCEERILDLAMARYAVAALDLLDEVDPSELTAATCETANCPILTLSAIQVAANQ